MGSDLRPSGQSLTSDRKSLLLCVAQAQFLVLPSGEISAGY